MGEAAALATGVIFILPGLYYTLTHIYGVSFWRGGGNAFFLLDRARGRAYTSLVGEV